LEAAIPSPRTNSRSNRPLETGGLIDYCWRPRCRTEFRRTGGPGRRQEYCSEVCRRAAEKELRQARSQLAHFEEVVEKLRIDVAAFGRPDSDEVGDDSLSLSLDGRRTAEDALRRASGVLDWANPDEPAIRELRRLYEAVAPVVLHDTRAS
jgi:hypothetical protein